jgi:hypothetical protein
VKVRDEGALGGSSHVILRPTEGGDEEDDTTVYSGGWNPDLSVRWIDARTIAVDGEWQMPFVDNSINTDSIRTSGTTIDALGYIHNLLPRGERVVMLNGLSFVMSRGFFGELLTRFEPGESRSWQEFKRAGASSSSGLWPYRLLAMDVPSEVTLWETARGGELLGNSNDGTIEVR